MVKQVMIVVVAVIIGSIVGSVVMMALHFASMLVYPIPEGIDFVSQDPDNIEKLEKWFETLPAGAFLLASASHGIGCMAGAAVAMLITGRRSLVAPLIVGILFTIGGIMNLSSVPHPAWFPFVDVPIYLILAGIAGVGLKRQTAE